MSLFKRKTGELNQPPVVSPTWSNRLGNVGDAIDAIGHDVRDVAVVTHGGPGDSGSIINLLGYRQGQYHVGWASMMYKLDAEATSPAATSQGAWGSRLRALGALLDEQRVSLRAVTIVDLPAGTAVNAITPSLIPGENPTIRSFQFTNEQIEATATNQQYQAAARSTMRAS